VEMTPNGMFASEKCDPRGMLSQDRSVAMVVELMTVRNPRSLVYVVDNTDGDTIGVFFDEAWCLALSMQWLEILLDKHQ
jgi:hypothetical protein